MSLLRTKTLTAIASRLDALHELGEYDDLAPLLRLLDAVISKPLDTPALLLVLRAVEPDAPAATRAAAQEVAS